MHTAQHLQHVIMVRKRLDVIFKGSHVFANSIVSPQLVSFQCEIILIISNPFQVVFGKNLQFSNWPKSPGTRSKLPGSKLYKQTSLITYSFLTLNKNTKHPCWTKINVSSAVLTAFSRGFPERVIPILSTNTPVRHISSSLETIQ